MGKIVGLVFPKKKEKPLVEEPNEEEKPVEEKKPKKG